jgi:hypothetical protein
LTDQSTSCIVSYRNSINDVPLHQRHVPRKNTLDPLPLPSPVPLFFASHSATLSFEGSRLPSFLSLSAHMKVYLHLPVQNKQLLQRSLWITAVGGSGTSVRKEEYFRKRVVCNPTPVPLLSAESLTRAGGLRFVLRSFRSHGYAIHRGGPHVKPRPRRTGLLPRRTGLLRARRW